MTLLLEGMYAGRSYLLIGVIWIATTTAALSQPAIEEQQRLHFGILAVATNSSVSRFTYPQNGSNLNIEGQFVLIARGATGLYSFSGFPAYTTLNVTLDDTTLSVNGIGISEQLSVDDFDFLEITTDALGEAELSLGARLSTTGNGSSYEDSNYTGSTLLRVEYWQPVVQSYVFNTQIIDLQAELKSTLNIDQDQALHFGTLFAQSSNTSQASLSLSPSGTYTISEPDDSRLVSLVKPEQGILRVSGAASNHSLTITPQVTDVLLEHTENPGSAPHFILNDILTSPDTTGITDSNGELQIRVGGTLKTELTASPTVYPSGQYEGIYELTVSY